MVDPNLVRRTVGMVLACLLVCTGCNGESGLPESQFHRKGDVADTGGTVLDGVQVAAERTWAQERGPRPPVTERISLGANGVFDLRLDKSVGVELFFSRDGYYPESRFVMDPKQMGNPVELTDLHIVLQKKGVTTKLDRFRTSVIFSTESNETKGLLLDKPPDSRLNDAVRLYQEHIRVEPDIASDGKLATVDMPQYGWGVRLPRRLTFGFASAEGGFVFFKPKAAPKAHRQMCRAPEKGYEGRMVLTAEDLVVSTKDHQGAYFYAKIAGKYGRGCITATSMSDDARKLQLDVSIFMQPDGSRNLEDDQAIRE